MSVYTNPPEWEAQGKKPPSSKRTEGWKPGDRVPASWLNWFWFSTVNSLREIAQAVKEHSQKTTAVHGVGQQYVAKTSRSDQWPSWNDIPDKPSTFPVDAATLPQASTSQAGIVQLTNSRTSTREDLALTAKAMNDHRASADHDDRYYTKAQIDELLRTRAIPGAVGQYVGDGALLRTINVGFTPIAIAILRNGTEWIKEYYFWSVAGVWDTKLVPNGFTLEAAPIPHPANRSGVSYTWIAIGGV